MSADQVYDHRDVFHRVVEDLSVARWFNEGDGIYYLDVSLGLRGHKDTTYLSRQQLIDHTSPREFNARLHDATKHLTDLLTRELKFRLATHRKDETA